MKLKNPITIQELRKFYIKNKWSHCEVKEYLQNHYNIKVSIRTLKRWRKHISNTNWAGPKSPKPPTPAEKATQKELIRILRLRQKTGWGPLILKHIFNANVVSDWV